MLPFLIRVINNRFGLSLSDIKYEQVNIPAGNQFITMLHCNAKFDVNNTFKNLNFNPNKKYEIEKLFIVSKSNHATSDSFDIYFSLLRFYYCLTIFLGKGHYARTTRKITSTEYKKALKHYSV